MTSLLGKFSETDHLGCDDGNSKTQSKGAGHSDSLAIILVAVYAYFSRVTAGGRGKEGDMRPQASWHVQELVVPRQRHTLPTPAKRRRAHSALVATSCPQCYYVALVK